MVTEVGICNSALIKIGASMITSLLDATKEARICKEQYPKLRDAVLEAHPWRFAVRRASLALLPSIPAFEFGREFQLPTDCLLPISTEDGEVRYKIEGDHLLTSDTTVNLKYIARIVDSSKYTPLFAEALSCRMAVDLAYAISNNATLAQTMMGAYKAQLSEARTRNGQGAGTPDPIQANDWVNSRY